MLQSRTEKPACLHPSARADLIPLPGPGCYNCSHACSPASLLDQRRCPESRDQHGEGMCSVLAVVDGGEDFAKSQKESVRRWKEEKFRAAGTRREAEQSGVIRVSSQDIVHECPACQPFAPAVPSIDSPFLLFARSGTTILCVGYHLPSLASPCDYCSKGVRILFVSTVSKHGITFFPLVSLIACVHVFVSACLPVCVFGPCLPSCVSVCPGSCRLFA